MTEHVQPGGDEIQRVTALVEEGSIHTVCVMERAHAHVTDWDRQEYMEMF